MRNNYDADGTEILAAIENVNKAKHKCFYQDRLSLYKDVLTIADVVSFTGYNRRTAGEWIRDNKLKAFMYYGKYMISKCYLLYWLCSDEYNSIRRKSKTHESVLQKI